MLTSTKLSYLDLFKWGKRRSN